MLDSPIEQATEAELIDELAKRNAGLLLTILHHPMQVESKEEPRSIHWRGGFLQACGVATFTALKMQSLMSASANDSGSI